MQLSFVIVVMFVVFARQAAGSSSGPQTKSRRPGGLRFAPRLSSRAEFPRPLSQSSSLPSLVSQGSELRKPIVLRERSTSAPLESVSEGVEEGMPDAPPPPSPSSKVPRKLPPVPVLHRPRSSSVDSTRKRHSKEQGKVRRSGTLEEPSRHSLPPHSTPSSPRNRRTGAFSGMDGVRDLLEAISGEPQEQFSSLPRSSLGDEGGQSGQSTFIARGRRYGSSGRTLKELPLASLQKKMDEVRMLNKGKRHRGFDSVEDQRYYDALLSDDGKQGAYSSGSSTSRGSK